MNSLDWRHRPFDSRPHHTTPIVTNCCKTGEISTYDLKIKVRSTEYGKSPMVNNERRTVLKVLGGTAVIATMPSFANGAAADATLKSDEKTVPLSAGSELTITLSVDPVPTIHLVNNSDKLVIVRHVHPGIIHAGEKTFDINSIFSSGAYAIGAGRTRRVNIQPTYATQAEAEFPRYKYRNQPQRLVSVTGTDRRGPVVNSSRSFFA